MTSAYSKVCRWSKIFFDSDGMEQLSQRTSYDVIPALIDIFRRPIAVNGHFLRSSVSHSFLIIELKDILWKRYLIQWNYDLSYFVFCVHCDG